MMRYVFLCSLISGALFAQGFREKRLSPIDPDQAQRFKTQPKIALLVGVSKYPSASGFHTLDYAAADVTDIGKTLTDGGYIVVVLTDADATRGAIVKTLRQVAGSVQAEDGTLLFYFSGHGFSVDGKAYLAPVSASSDDLEREGLAVSEVQQIMAASRAQRKMMMLDACRSESKEKGAGGRSFSSLEAARGFKILNSTKIDQVSYESTQMKHGVFSAFVLKGLQGAAAGDDGLVTFNDLSSYVSDSMRSWGIVNHLVQIPYERTEGEVSGDFLLTAVKPALPAPVVPSPSLDSSLMARADQLFASGRYSQALPLYRQVAEAGSPQAMNQIGSLYYAGRGVARDYAQAADWFRKAADAGDPDAMDKLGARYCDGQGVPQDFQQGMIWFRKAAAAGNSEGMENIGELYFFGNGVPKDYRQALTWFRTAADAGNSKAMNSLGRLYSDGKGVPQDYRQGMGWFRKGATVGNPTAMGNIGWLYEHGLGVPRDAEQALSWYRKAAEARDPMAMDNLGRCYELGIGIGKDRDQAIEWYRKAAAGGVEHARASLKHLGVNP
jgi:TPR repeat protein